MRDVETRCDSRNGYYQRDLGTRLGLLRGLRVPRARHGYNSELLPRYQRRQESVHGLVREAFLRGISTRQVGPVLEPVLGEAYSAQTISRIARGLDAAVEKYHRRALRDEYLYLFLLPASLPHLVSRLKQGWAFAWRSLLAGEMIFVSLDLGQLLMMGRDLNDISQVVAVMVLIVAIGYLVDGLVFRIIERNLRQKWGLVRAA